MMIFVDVIEEVRIFIGNYLGKVVEFNLINFLDGICIIWMQREGFMKGFKIDLKEWMWCKQGLMLIE